MLCVLAMVNREAYTLLHKVVVLLSIWHFPHTTSFQEGLPAELKHINKRRKRKQKRFPK